MQHRTRTTETGARRWFPIFSGNPAKTPAIQYLNSVRLRLTLVFLLFLLLVAGVGFFSIQRLSQFNQVSREISGKWLASTRILGDLNNSISDFRAAEGEYLITPQSREKDEIRRQIDEIDDLIQQSRREYENINHTETELMLFQRFFEEWRIYRDWARQVISLDHQGQQGNAYIHYQNQSKKAFNEANRSLLSLTNDNIKGAGLAVERQSMAYREAFSLIMLVIFVAILLLLTAIAALVAYVSKPILHLVGIMNRISGNELTLDIPYVRRSDEIGEMARAVLRFRDNTQELKNSKRALTEQAQQLQKNLEKERHLANLQRNFIGTLSHEFRTPLGVIDAHAQRLVKLKDRLDPGDLEERSLKIRAAVARMGALIHRLLDSSELLDREGGYQLQTTPFSPRQLVQEVCAMYRDSQAGAQILERYEPKLPAIQAGDEKLIFQAVANLLDNALKYSPPLSPVRVDLACDGKGLRLEIGDSGIGIAAKDLTTIFDRYVRGENVGGIVGAGVGLSLVKWVAELHGGTVEVLSQPQQGSRFILWLPLNPP